MQLEDLFDYKNQLMKDLLTNDTIVRLIDEQSNLETAPLLAYKQVFPYEFIPETLEYGKTYICFDVDIQKQLNKTFYVPTIYVWVFTHQSKMRLPEGGVRTDKLASEIAKAINGSRMYGLGELDLYSIRRFAPATDYQGKMMTFHAIEFNRPAPNMKPIPANRKKGQ